MFRLIGIVFILAGLVFGASGLRAWSRRRADVAGWPKVTGTVVSDSVRHVGGTTAEVEFTTLDGRAVRAAVPSAVDIGIDARGRTVPVWYDPADPQRVHADVHAGDSSPLPPVVLGATLVVLGFVALAVL